eukprot:6893329-Prymnesium_polylepis.1
MAPRAAQRTPLSVRSCGAATVVATAAHRGGAAAAWQSPRPRRWRGTIGFYFGVAVRCVAPPMHLGKGYDLGAHARGRCAERGCATRESCMFGVAVVRGQPACVCMMVV